MRLGALGFRSVDQKLRILIVAVPILVLVITLTVNYYCTKGWLHGDELRNYRTEIRTGAKALDAFFRRIAIFPRCIAARQRVLSPSSLPDLKTQDFLLEMLLSATSEKECHGLYIAFDGINPGTHPDGMQWVDRKSFKKTRISYDHNKPDVLSRWYHGALAQWRRDLKLGIPANDRDHYVGEPTFDAGSSNELLVSITQVVHDQNDRIIGVAGVDLKCSTLNEFIRTIVEEQNERMTGNRTSGIVAFLLSSSNKIIARTDGNPLPETPVSFEAESGMKRLELESSAEGRPVVADGSRRRLFWTTAEKSGWKIVLSVPEAEIDASAGQMVVRSTLVGSIGPAIMVLLASIAAGWLTGPIPKLTAAAEAVEAGDYRGDGLASIASRKDEFGQLARGFQRMVEEVSTREGQLKQAKDDILSRERHYRSLIENGSDVIAVLDRDGTIRYESPSARRVLGYEPAELVGTDRFSSIHPDDLAAVTEAFDRRMRGLPVEPVIEYRFRHKDGSWRVLEATSTNLLDDPAVGGIVVNSRDVTDRKRAQAEIDDLRRRHSEELEGRVRVRTAELAHKNEELKAANEATDQAMKLQEVFLSNVAHDLRTPLTIVIGYSDDLLRRAKKKGQDAFIPDLKLIVNKGKDLLELINDLLNLSKAMNEKGVELDLKRFDLEPMIRSRMEGIGAISQKQSNTIDLRLAPDVGAMFADESKVWRILMNLLTNACKFTRGGTITLSAERATREVGDRLVFRVTDTGMGMSPEQTAKLFDRFSQVHASSGKMQAGVGLGLSICQLYCKAMGGMIRVESEVGQGTTFLVDLPAEVEEKSKATPAPTRPIPAPSTASAIVPIEDRANLVLIIDDDVSVCELMRRNLGEEGFPSRSAHSGEEGLRLAKQLLPSAIILDIMMPGIDGWAVLAALKTDSQMSEIPVIMASMLDERERGLQMGADEYVSKPLGPDRLADLLHKHLQSQNTGKILCIEDRSENRESLAASLREQGWEVREATDGRIALDILRESAPDLILLDLTITDSGGMSILAEIRGNAAWNTIPIIVITSAHLDSDERRRLQGQVEKIFTGDVFGRDDLLREVRTLVTRHRRESPSPPVEETHV